MHPLFEALKARGWLVELTASPVLPAILTARYPSLDLRIWDVLGQVERCVRSGNASWLLSAADYESTSSSAFHWNEYEEIALEDAESATDRIAIRSFWDAHIPFLLAVTSDYDYLAIRVADGAVVHGFAPEWEQPEVLAESFSSFVCRVTNESPDADAYPWSIVL